MKVMIESKREILYPALKDRSHTLIEFAQGYDEVMNAPQSYDEKMRSKLDNTALDSLQGLSTAIESNMQIWQSVADMEEFLHAFAEERGIKIGKLMPAIRCAMLGKSGGIGVCECLIILGRDECLKRLETFSTKNA